jgi:hypothetical protein
MTLENMTQRGFNAGATHDSVAAYARIASRAILLGGEAASKFLEAVPRKITSDGGLTNGESLNAVCRSVPVRSTRWRSSSSRNNESVDSGWPGRSIPPNDRPGHFTGPTE